MRRALVPRIAASFVAIASLAVSPSAVADPAPATDPAAAEALFERGKAQWKAGEFADACSKFEASMALDPSVSTEIKIARCREREGKLAAAWYAYERASAICRGKKDLSAERRAALEKNIADALGELTPRLPWFRVRVAALVPGLRVSRNGVVLPAGSFGELLPADPGEILVRAEAPGYVGMQRRIVLREGERADMDVALAVAPDWAGMARATRAREQRSVGIGVAGAGLTALAIAGVLGVHTQRLVADSNPLCTPSDACEPRGISLRDDARSYQTAAIATAIGGAVVLGAGLVIYGLAGRK